MWLCRMSIFMAFLSFASIFGTYDIPLLLGSMQHFFISHTVGLADLLHPIQTPYFETSQVFLIYLLKCPNFKTIKSYAPNVAFCYYYYF